jgi:endonuclease/exonuclease/phosphatase family metal-dependent hydrolase
LLINFLLWRTLINNNNDCHAVVGGDFNVDFSRDMLHTALLNSFCDNIRLSAIIRHNKSTIDYSYHFNLDRFSILDHFLLSNGIFDNLVDRAYAKHDVDNISDHEPISIQLLMDFKYAGFSDRTYAPHISWPN